MKLRAKIFLCFGSFTVTAILAIFLLSHLLIEKNLFESAKSNLKKNVEAMHLASESLLNAAIESYLRGVVDRNLDLVQHYYDAWQRGELSEQEAKDAIQQLANAQKVGTSGYIAALADRDGILSLDIHPFLRGTDCSDTEGCQQWQATRDGFLQYPWKNPKDNSIRTKVAYLEEFKPWNWIVGATSYKDELTGLLKMSDLKRLISSAKIFERGYFFVFDSEAKILIHPELEGAESKEGQSECGTDVLNELISKKDGYLTYSWENPSEAVAKDKYAYVSHMEDFDWYLVGTGYLDEVNAPVSELKAFMAIAVSVVVLILVVFIFIFSRTLTRPLQEILKGINKFYQSGTIYRMQGKAVQEIQLLGRAFGTMTVELNRSQEENRRANALLDNIINSMPSALIAVDKNLGVIQWNAEAQRRADVGLEHETQRDLNDIFPDLATFWQTLKISDYTKAVVNLPMPVREGEDGKVYENLTVYPLVTNGIEGAVIRIDNVTERIQLEDALHQSQKMDAIGQLAGGIAHDFNNMLGGILGAAQILEMQDFEDAKVQKWIKIIKDSAIRSAELTNKLLTFSRKQPASLAPVSVHDALNDAVSLLKRSIDKKVRITCDFAALHDSVVGDLSQLQSSFMNMGINASHAMPDGGDLGFFTKEIALSESYCAKSSFDLNPGKYFQVEVRDTGCGIAKELIDKIFDPFFTTKKLGEGTGLGLSLVYGVVKQHKGMIDLKSNEGQGTSFFITLPLTEETSAATSDIDKVHYSGEGTILVIDDEEGLRATAETLLKEVGYLVFTAPNGKTGINIYQENEEQIDLVLLDMVMPEMDGKDCFQKIKEINSDVKVIVTSGYCMNEDARSLSQQGAAGFLAKPYQSVELLFAVRKALLET